MLTWYYDQRAQISQRLTCLKTEKKSLRVVKGAIQVFWKFEIYLLNQTFDFGIEN